MLLLRCFSLVQLLVSLWTIAHQAPVHGILQARILQYVAMPSAGDLPDPGIKPAYLISPALVDRFFITSATWEAPLTIVSHGI